MESGPLHSKAEWSRRAEEQNNRWYGKVYVKRAWWQKRASLNLTGDWPHGSQYYSSVSAVEWHNTKRSMDRQKACDFTSEDIRLQSLCPSSEGEEDRMTKVSKKMTLLSVKILRLINFIHLNNCSVWFQEMQYLLNFNWKAISLSLLTSKPDWWRRGDCWAVKYKYAS